MNYAKIPPPAYLEKYVHYFWTSESCSLSQGATMFRPITDGCLGLLIQLSETTTLQDQDNKQLPSLCLYGQTIKHREIHIGESLKAIGVCFAPVALQSIFGLNANELTDTCLDMNVLAGSQPHRLQERLLEASSIERQLTVLSNHLLTQITKNDSQTDGVTDHALLQLVQSNGSIPLKTLHTALRVSERNLERRFRQRVGISPKLFARICRFQASYHQLIRNQYGKLSDIAFDNGYADQSHFIRVFREFAGFSPDQYRKQANLLMTNPASVDLL